MSQTALVHPSTETAPAHTPRYKRLGHQHVKTIFELHKLGKTQTEIAQALGCDQATVSRWLATTQDTRDLATQFLAHNALPMAQTIVKKGKPDVQLKALQGLGVAAQGTQTAGVQVFIGCKDSDVSITLSPPLSESTERKVAESLTIQAGSDK